MNKIQTLLTTQGFKIPATRSGYADFSFLSLRIAIQAYAATADDLTHLVSYLGNGFSVEQIDAAYSTAYLTNCTQCIIHIQHFIELFVKNVLRTIHEALACNVTDKPVILAKLLKHTPLTTKEVADLKTVELSEALNRLSAVIKEGLLAAKFQFLAGEIDWMKEVNVLRNRIMHRGVFMLRPQGLDELFGAYIFPFLAKVLAIPDFVRDEIVWKYKPLACGLEPLTELAAMFATAGSYDLKKTILLKQLILGGYANPLVQEAQETAESTEPFAGFFDRVPSLNELQQARAERSARNRKTEDNASEIDNCPVCGTNSLVVYQENVEVMEGVDVELELHLRCECCEFSSSYPSSLAPIAAFLHRQYW